MENDTQAPGFNWEMALAPNTLPDPYSLSERVLENYPPLFFAPARDTRMGQGMWVATRFDPIREIFQNTDHYSSEGVYPYFALLGEDLRAIPISIDPPEHGKYRKLLEPWFTPRAIMGREVSIRRNVERLIDSFAQSGECDASYDFSRIYPVKVFMEIMGFPEEMFEDFLSWSHPMHFEMDNPERMIWGARQAFTYMRGFIENTRRAPRNEALASQIVYGELDGRPLTDDEVIGIIFFMWDGGMDTVAATSSLMFRRLGIDLELQQHLRDNPGRMANAVEEFLRMHPTVNTIRIAKCDHLLEGQQIKAGDRLLCLAASGNFDPDKYDDPRTFRLDRAQNNHMTFVAGPHRCLGIHLARYELRIALGEFFNRIPPFRLKPGADCVAMPGLVGAPHVPLVWGDS